MSRGNGDISNRIGPRDIRDKGGDLLGGIHRPGVPKGGRRPRRRCQGPRPIVHCRAGRIGIGLEAWAGDIDPLPHTHIAKSTRIENFQSIIKEINRGGRLIGIPGRISGGQAKLGLGIITGDGKDLPSVLIARMEHPRHRREGENQCGRKGIDRGDRHRRPRDLLPTIAGNIPGRRGARGPREGDPRIPKIGIIGRARVIRKGRQSRPGRYRRCHGTCGGRVRR